ncbi:MAG: hypothetical protein LDLANPLL_01816 [Turneriella sp.]|nr:hypothetical protein [Turneriella sp.]
MPTQIGSKPDSDIILHTRLRTCIQNLQVWSPLVDPNISKAMFESEFPRAVLRTEPTEVYNCHGMVFAARRTKIIENADVQTILNEDSYHEIPFMEVLEGDIIVYFAGDGDAEHSGVICRIQDLQGVRMIFVVSKWGALGEYIHKHNECPYVTQNMKFFRAA